jgi:hypothetical protein
MLPKNSPEDPGRLVEGRGVVLTSIHSSRQFHITVEWQGFKANHEDVLNEKISMHISMYRQPLKT